MRIFSVQVQSRCEQRSLTLNHVYGKVAVGLGNLKKECVMGVSVVDVAQEQEAPLFKKRDPLFEACVWDSNESLGAFAIVTFLNGTKFLYTFLEGKMQKSPIE